MVRRTPAISGITVLGVLFAAWLMTACTEEKKVSAPDVPRGYVQRIEIEQGDRIITFGPFVGYYFQPVKKGDFSHLKFLTYNERSYYTSDLPENAKIFEGDAVLQTLGDDVDFIVPADDRINPVMFADAPASWLENRPKPQDEFVHYHSCYDALGSVLTGYWLRHVGTATYTYDMGERLGPASILYHTVTPGVDTSFARILEFDKGPALEEN